MKPEDLLKGLNNIDDELIEEALKETHSRHRRGRIFIIPVAAAACLTLLIGYSMTKMNNSAATMQYDEEAAEAVMEVPAGNAASGQERDQAEKSEEADNGGIDITFTMGDRTFSISGNSVIMTQTSSEGTGEEQTVDIPDMRGTERLIGLLNEADYLVVIGERTATDDAESSDSEGAVSDFDITFAAVFDISGEEPEHIGTHPQDGSFADAYIAGGRITLRTETPNGQLVSEFDVSNP